MFRLALPLLTLCAALSSALISQPLYAGYDQDHPLFAAYPNATLVHSQMSDYEKFTLPVSLVDSTKEPAAFTALDLVGDVYRHQYQIPNVSSLKVFENYLAAAKQLGFKPLFSCALDACGADNLAAAIATRLAINGDVSNYYRNPYYWIGEKESPKGKITAAWFIGAFEDEVAVQQVIVEAEPLETGLVKVDAAYANQAAMPTQLQPLSAEDKAEDNAMLSRYPGATTRNHKNVDTETVKIPFAINATEKTPLQLTGD